MATKYNTDASNGRAIFEKVQEESLKYWMANPEVAPAASLPRLDRFVVATRDQAFYRASLVRFFVDLPSGLCLQLSVYDASDLISYLVEQYHLERRASGNEHNVYSVPSELKREIPVSSKVSQSFGIVELRNGGDVICLPRFEEIRLYGKFFFKEGEAETILAARRESVALESVASESVATTEKARRRI